VVQPPGHHRALIGAPVGVLQPGTEFVMRIVTVGAYPPYWRGSALFASELRAVLPAVAPAWHVDVCAVDPSGLPRRAGTQAVVSRDDHRAYHRAARAIVAAGADLAVVQYDRDVFGGPNGAYLLDLVAELRRRELPYAITMHGLPDNPSADQRSSLAALCREAAAVVTFTADARTLLRRSGIAPQRHCTVLPRGAPWQLRRPFHIGALRPPVVRCLRQLRNARLLTTLGPTTPDRGLHDVVAALPSVIERHPNAMLLVAGTAEGTATEHSNAAYPHHLRQLATRIGVQDHVEFLDTHLSTQELTAVLARTDLFVSPYPNASRDCSAPLTYAVAAGRPVVATAYRYATEIFTARPDRTPGALVPCHDAGALAVAIDHLLGNPAALAQARADAKAIGASLTWDVVAAQYAKVFRQAASSTAADASPR
jgi:glycosyltransferase involved in cell wall biosynthesis